MKQHPDILLIANRDSFWTKEFVDKVLCKIGANVFIQYDPTQKESFDSFYEEAGVHFVQPFSLSPLLLKIPKLRVLYKNQKKRNAYSKISNAFDFIIILYVSLSSAKYANIVSRGKIKVFAHFIGSDILRVTDKTASSLKKILSKSNSQLVFESNQTEHAYRIKTNSQSSKTNKIIFLGIESSLPYIDEEIKGNHNNCKAVFEIPADKITVCIGYNASSAQQHLNVIEQLKKLPREIKSKIFIIVPVAYGGSIRYLNIVEKELLDSGIDFRMLDSFYNPKEIAKLRVATDIFINAQKTDSLSASVLESYYAGSKIINARWLYYKEFYDLGLDFYTFNTFDDVPVIVERLVKSAEIEPNKNREQIFNNFSWEKCKTEWERLLKENKNND